MEISISAGVVTPDVFVLTVGNDPFRKKRQCTLDAARGLIGGIGAAAKPGPAGAQCCGGYNFQRVSG